MGQAEQTNTKAPIAEVETGPRMIVLGGAAYRVVDFSNRTILQDHYGQRWMRKIGIDRTLPDADEDSTVFVVRLQCLIMDSLLGPHLIAGFLVPQDAKQ